MTINKEWFFSENEKKSGPFSTETMVELIDGGKIIANTLLWKEGYEHWIDAYTCSEFETHFQRTTPPPLPVGKEGARIANNEAQEHTVPYPKKQNVKLITKTLLASLASGFVINILQGEFYFTAYGIGSALGTGIAFFAMTYLIALVPQGLYWVVKRGRMPGFNTVVWSIWVLLILLYAIPS